MWIYTVPATLDELEEAQQDALWAAGAQGLEERGGTVRAYFAGQEYIPEVAGEWSEEAEQDWQAEFKRGVQAVQAGRVTIAPPWLVGEIPASQHALIIEPGLAFGTGHHATTRLAVEALGGAHGGPNTLTGCTVLDVGAGSGVLAMAAAKLGAALAYGLDTDPQTVPVARSNAAQNGLSTPQVQFEEGTLRPDAFAAPSMLPERAEGRPFLQGGYDVLVANLFAELHDLLMPAYMQHLRAGGTLILTGILAERAELVHSALERSGARDMQEVREGAGESSGEWVLITARKAAGGDGGAEA